METIAHTSVGERPFLVEDIGVIRVTYPEPANITLKEYFKNVHPSFGNVINSRPHIYNDWPTEVSMFFLEALCEVTGDDVLKALVALRCGAAAYEEMLAYYEWWKKSEREPRWMVPTVALGSVFLDRETRCDILVPAMTRNVCWFNAPDLWLHPRRGPWSEGTRFLAIHRRGFEELKE